MSTKQQCIHAYRCAILPPFLVQFLWLNRKLMTLPYGRKLAQMRRLKSQVHSLLPLRELRACENGANWVIHPRYINIILLKRHIIVLIYSTMHVNTLYIFYALFPPFFSSPTITQSTFVLRLASARTNRPQSNLRYIHTYFYSHTKNSIDKMSQPLQSQSDFIDIRMNNGHHLGVDTFKAILNGRFHGEMQLAFEQYLTDFKFYGVTYRTYRYEIVNGNMLVLQKIFDPLTAGPVRAAPVTRRGPQYPNAQTQGSVYQTPYASQPNQPVANFPGYVNPSTVQTMRYARANTAQMSTSPPRQLNPHAPEFRFSSAVNAIGSSARSSALPTANSVPAYPPGLPVTQQHRSAPADAYQSYSAPDHNMQLSRNYGEAVSAAAVSSMSNKPYSSLIHLQSQVVSRQPQLTPSDVRPGHYGSVLPPVLYDAYIASRQEEANKAAGLSQGSPSNTPILLTDSPTTPQQPQPLRLAPTNSHGGALTLNTGLGPFDNDYGVAVEAPASPPALAPEYSNASGEVWMTPVSPLDLGPPNSSITDNQHLPPRQGSRQASEHNSDYSSDCGSMGYLSTIDMKNPGDIIKWVSLSTANGSVPLANDTNNTAHSPQNGEIDSGIGSSRPSPERHLQPRASIAAMIEHHIQQGWQLPPATLDENLPSNTLTTYLTASPFQRFYNYYYNNWVKWAPPGSTLLDFAKLYDAVVEGNSDELNQHFARFFDSLEHRAQMRSEELAQLELQQPDTTPSQGSQDPPSATVSHPAGPSMVSNGTNAAHAVAQSDAPAAQQSTWTSRHIASSNRVTLSSPAAPQQLHHGEDRIESDYTPYLYPHPAVDAQLEARFPADSLQEDPRIGQRLHQNLLDFDEAYGNVLEIRREAEAASR